MRLSSPRRFPSFQFLLRSSDPSVATTTPAKMEGTQDWYLHEDLTNLFLLDESELLFLDVVSGSADDQGEQQQQQDLTGLVAKETPTSPATSLAKTGPTYDCPLCSKSFRFKSRLQRHLTSHQGKQYGCNQCDKHFSRQDVLQAHRRKAHGISSDPAALAQEGGKKAKVMISCPHCPAQLSSTFHYQRHIRAHEKNLGSFQCGYCAKIFPSRRKYSVHLKYHLGEKKHACPTCGQKFLQEEFLKRHQRVHSREKPYQCQSCGQTFAQQIHLQRHHYRKHSSQAQEGRKEYRCSLCPKVFLTSLELKNHQLYHTSHRAFACQWCSLSFVEKGHLDRHIRRIHQGLRRYPCTNPGCGKAFYEKYELNYHLKSRCPRRSSS